MQKKSAYISERAMKRDSYFVDEMYVSKDVPIVKSTWAQGTSKHRLTSFVGNFANTVPTPSTSFTAIAAATANL